MHKRSRRRGIVYTLLLLSIPMLVLAGYVGPTLYYRYAAVPEVVGFTGSTACESCHRQDYEDWHDSLHPKMMRRPGGETILADFSSPDAPARFDVEDVHWVIGSKWEQQFMGSDGITETLLPGAWLVADERWKTTAWDGWQAPVPLYRCHGCHTVGLDTETGHFIEPGIGCESCHGAGQWHVETRGHGQIYTSLDSQQCGQCHTRGRSSDGAYFFPYSYRPGDQLTDFFVEWEPDYIQNSSAWWGNGRERKRHQEYTVWKLGGHADALKTLQENYDGRFGAVSEDCMGCHSGEGALAAEQGVTISLDEAETGIGCPVCHQSHGSLDTQRIDCATCHTKGPFHHQDDNWAEHVPCPVEAEVTCVDCHMPLTGRNGGAYTLHSHHPGIVPPQDTAEFGVPNSCANGGCHADNEGAWLEAKILEFYGNDVAAD